MHKNELNKALTGWVCLMMICGLLILPTLPMFLR